MGQSFERLIASHKLDVELASRLRRKLAAHSYSSIDWAIVHAIATRHLGDFARFVDWIGEQD